MERKRRDEGRSDTRCQRICTADHRYGPRVRRISYSLQKRRVDEQAAKYAGIVTEKQEEAPAHDFDGCVECIASNSWRAHVWHRMKSPIWFIEACCGQDCMADLTLYARTRRSF